MSLFDRALSLIAKTPDHGRAIGAPRAVIGERGSLGDSRLELNDMPSPDVVREWAEAYRVAWETSDSAAAAALFTENATYRSNIFEEPHRGQDGIAAYWSGVTSTQSEITVRMGDPVVDGSRAEVEFWTTMAVEGAPVSLAGCLLLDFDETGLCTALREYWNLTDGTLQPPPGWGG